MERKKSEKSYKEKERIKKSLKTIKENKWKKTKLLIIVTFLALSHTQSQMWLHMLSVCLSIYLSDSLRHTQTITIIHTFFHSVPLLLSHLSFSLV